MAGRASTGWRSAPATSRYDNEAPFTTQEDFDGLLRAALDYLERDRDTRGDDPVKGWMHATGHTADVLKFLARSPRLAVADQRKLLEAVAAGGARTKLLETLAAMR